MNLLQELRRRNVLRVGTAYLVVGWFVLQSVDVVFPILGLSESLGRPILALLLIGLPVALLLAWFLEITPEGVKHERDIDRSLPPAPRRGRMLDRVIIVVLLAALGLLLAERFLVQPAVPQEPAAAAATEEHSMAVLPFVNLNGSTEDDYFADGLTESLLHMLAQIPRLRVAARTSVFALKGRDLDVREIAERLGVAHILEGSVQRSGNKVRITAQLIEAATGFQLWSQSFDKNLDDIFAVQDEIANDVANALQITLLRGADNGAVRVAGVGTGNTAAYEFYLQGLEQKNIASYASLPQAENLFKRALAADPQFSDAKLELAKVYQLQAETGLIRIEDAEARIQPQLEQILETRPDDGRAIGMLASIGLDKAIRTTGALSDAALRARDALESALDLAPNETDLYAAMTDSYMAADEPQKALEWTDRGIKVDPLSARLHLQRGRILLHHLLKPQEALEAFTTSRNLAPRWTAAIFAIGDAEMQLGEYGRGIAWYLDAMAADPQDHEMPLVIARLYYALGLDEEGDRMYERARAMAPQEPWTRSLELERQLRADNYERAAQLAESMLREGIENRGDAFNLAVMGYVNSMIEIGQAEHVPEFFESLQPGISSPDFRPAGIRDLTMQFALVFVRQQLGDYDSVNRMLAAIVPAADDGAPGWRDNAEIRMMLALAQGDDKAAVNYAIEDLDKPLAERLDWELTYRHTAWVKPLLADERVAERLRARDELTAAAAREVMAQLHQQREENLAG